MIQLLTDVLESNPFFQLDNAEVWIQHAAFQAYMSMVKTSSPTKVLASIRTSSASRSSTPYVNAAHSRSSSRGNFIPSSPSPSPRGLPNGSEDQLSDDELQQDLGSRHGHWKRARSPAMDTNGPKRKRSKAQQPNTNISITGKLKVQLIKPLDEIPSTWTVPRIPTAYLVNANGMLLQTRSGGKQSLDAFIRSEVCFIIFICYNLPFN